MRLLAQRCGVVVVDVDVDVVSVVVVEVEVDVDVLVDVDVVLVVVSHPAQVLAHCFAIKMSEHSCAANRRSHLVSGKIFTLLAHLCSVDVVEVDVDVVIVEVDVDVEVLVDDEVDVLVEVLVDVDVEVLVEVEVDVVVVQKPSLSASLPGSVGQGSSFPQIPSLSTSFSGSKSHLSKHSVSQAQGHTLQTESTMHLPAFGLPSL